jgi:phage terminase large subunit-like protein
VATKKPTQREIYESLLALKQARTYRAMDFFTPYPKQEQFVDLGIGKRERLLMAANQVGKSHIGAFELACHLTGAYPDWWLGRTWDRPTRWWAAGETGILVRDVQQKKLCGEAGVESAFGTGLIPKDRFVDKPSMMRGVTDAYDTVQVKHNSGGVSVLRFKSYEMGRKKFQGETLDGIWFDEEPPEEIYLEGITRTSATNGLVYLTFTPLLGRSAVVRRFIEGTHADRGMINMTDEDAAHITPEMRARNRASWPGHQVDARAKGIPLLGSGQVYTTPEEDITHADLTEIPPHWYKLWGIDFGLGRKFAAVLILHDRDTDTIYVHRALKPAIDGSFLHAQLMQKIAAAVPVAWPHDGNQRDKGSGETLSKMYAAHGLRMLPNHATHETGGYAVEAGIFEIAEREKTERLKVAKHLSDWFEERRFYHRRDGLIVKENDHLMDATRYAVMMKRFAQPVAVSASPLVRRRNQMADGIDFDLWG